MLPNSVTIIRASSSQRILQPVARTEKASVVVRFDYPPPPFFFSNREVKIPKSTIIPRKHSQGPPWWSGGKDMHHRIFSAAQQNLLHFFPKQGGFL